MSITSQATQHAVVQDRRDEAAILVGTKDELAKKGTIVVRGADRPIAVFWNDGKPAAVDNRCPHMGFPLSKGTVQDGILTCHWHHARFDLRSGCTFDLFADDAPVYDVEVRGQEVYVSAAPRQGDQVERYRRRLREGMEQNISLIQAKSIIGLIKSGVDYREIVREIALFGVKNRESWASGMTILTAMANVVPLVSEEAAYLALYQGSRRVANDASGMPPARERHALETDGIPLDILKRWLRDWTEVRHRDGAERTLLTAVQNGANPAELTDVLFTAAAERYYADTGHVLDFCNKSFELLDLIGWQHAPQVLQTLAPQLVSARGGQETNAWRSPVDLVPPIEALQCELPNLLQTGEEKRRAGAEFGIEGVRALAKVVLGDDALAILGAIRSALSEGARPEEVSKAVSYAAAMRIARFGTANEFGDWIAVLHTFTYCNAAHQAIRRSPSPDVFRAAIHGAMSVFLDRFRNIPPAKLPGEQEPLDDEPTDAQALLDGFLDALDQRQKVEAAARAVARYLQLGHPVEPLFDALTLAVVREDADFHTFQMLEAGIRQYREWEGESEGAQILVAVARYLAAHSPTERAQLQTAQIALKLHRGGTLYEEEL